MITQSTMKALARVRKDSAASAKTMSDAALREGIAAISAELKGVGIGPKERLARNEERGAMRDELADRAIAKVEAGDA